MTAKNTIAEQKSDLRKLCRQRIKSIGFSQWQMNGKKMSDLLLSSDIWEKSKCIFCFVSVNNEPDTSAVLSQAINQGKTLCVPRIIGDGIMQAVAITSIDEFETATMGIMEPSVENNNIISAEKIDLAVVPCMAGTLDGFRLGKGGGYYDRFLAGYYGNSVLFCADDLILEKDEIPLDSHDIKCGYIATQTKLIKCE